MKYTPVLLLSSRNVKKKKTHTHTTHMRTKQATNKKNRNTRKHEHTTEHKRHSPARISHELTQNKKNSRQKQKTQEHTKHHVITPTATPQSHLENRVEDAGNLGVLVEENQGVRDAAISEVHNRRSYLITGRPNQQKKARTDKKRGEAVRGHEQKTKCHIPQHDVDIFRTATSLICMVTDTLYLVDHFARWAGWEPYRSIYQVLCMIY